MTSDSAFGRACREREYRSSGLMLSLLVYSSDGLKDRNDISVQKK